jgi:uncharacterized protein (DUF58 family)
MYLPRKPVGTAVIAIMLFLMVHLGATLPSFPSPGWLYYVLAVGLTIVIIYWVGSEPKQIQSRRKVEKVLRDLNDEDLDLLRSRLMHQDQSDDYGSMNELIQSGKRKNNAGY